MSEKVRLQMTLAALNYAFANVGKFLLTTSVEESIKGARVSSIKQTLGHIQEVREVARHLEILCNEAIKAVGDYTYSGEYAREREERKECECAERQNLAFVKSSNGICH